MKIVGKVMTVDETFREIIKDLPFFRNSGGGITLSGGEPLMQVDFAVELLKTCNENNIHTAIETSGYSSWDNIIKILPFTDLFLYDIKHMDPSKHEQFIGVSNHLILENVRKISDRGKDIIIRVPVVPGINDSDDNLKAIATFVSQLKSVKRITLLPYHSLGEPKYTQFGLRYKLNGLTPPKREQMDRACSLIEAKGLRCMVL